MIMVCLQLQTDFFGKKRSNCWNLLFFRELKCKQCSSAFPPSVSCSFCLPWLVMNKCHIALGEGKGEAAEASANQSWGTCCQPLGENMLRWCCVRRFWTQLMLQSEDWSFPTTTDFETCIVNENLPLTPGRFWYRTFFWIWVLWTLSHFTSFQKME